MLRQMSPVLLTTLVGIIVIIIFAVFFRDDGTVPQGEVGLEIGAPIQHSLASPQFPVIVRLVNNSDRDLRITAANKCKIFRFIIMRPDGVFKQASGDDPRCETSGAVEDILPAQSVKEDVHIIGLERERFSPGKYAIQVRYWGYEKSTRFALSSDD